MTARDGAVRVLDKEGRVLYARAPYTDDFPMHPSEHGSVDPGTSYGPEWWAMGREVCRCGDPADDHPRAVDGLFPCRRLDCNCPDFRAS